MWWQLRSIINGNGESGRAGPTRYSKLAPCVARCGVQIFAYATINCSHSRWLFALTDTPLGIRKQSVEEGKFSLVNALILLWIEMIKKNNRYTLKWSDTLPLIYDEPIVNLFGWHNWIAFIDNFRSYPIVTDCFLPPGLVYCSPLCQCR